jgi:hypothetical protein
MFDIRIQNVARVERGNNFLLIKKFKITLRMPLFDITEFQLHIPPGKKSTGMKLDNATWMTLRYFLK